MCGNSQYEHILKMFDDIYRDDPDTSPEKYESIEKIYAKITGLYRPFMAFAETSITIGH